jgi:hypothetical protein
MPRQARHSKIAAVAAAVHALDGHGGKRKQPVHNNLTYGSTNADYLARRIARDHPDMLQRMKAGEYRNSPISPRDPRAVVPFPPSSMSAD